VSFSSAVLRCGLEYSDLLRSAGRLRDLWDLPYRSSSDDFAKGSLPPRGGKEENDVEEDGEVFVASTSLAEKLEGFGNTEKVEDEVAGGGARLRKVKRDGVSQTSNLEDSIRDRRTLLRFTNVADNGGAEEENAMSVEIVDCKGAKFFVAINGADNCSRLRKIDLAVSLED